jgi:hypothetical protein
VQVRGETPGGKRAFRNPNTSSRCNPPLLQRSVFTLTESTSNQHNRETASLIKSEKKRLSIHRQRWDICTHIFAWSEPHVRTRSKKLSLLKPERQCHALLSSKPFRPLTERLHALFRRPPCLDARSSYRTRSYILHHLFHHISSIIHTGGWFPSTGRGERTICGCLRQRAVLLCSFLAFCYPFYEEAYLMRLGLGLLRV